MILTARLWLLSQLETQIENLISANGYELNAKRFVLGFNPTSETEFPFICYDIYNDEGTPITDDKQADILNTTCIIVLDYVIKSEENVQGSLAMQGERALNDFRKFVHGANDISPDKILNFAPNRTTNNIHWYIRSNQKALDNVQGNGIATSVIQVTFTENLSSQLTQNLIEEH